MTAEVALLNKRAVAMAADSAVTYRGRGNQKVFESANKIFSLSKYKPIGVMIYGTAEIMEVPWEIVVKLYREQLGRDSYDELEDYADDFLDFLGNLSILQDDDLQRKLAGRILKFNFSMILQQAQSKAEQVLDETGELTHSELKLVVKLVIQRYHKQWDAVRPPPSNPENYRERVADQYGELIQKFKEARFEGLLTPTSSRWLREIGEYLLTRFAPQLNEVGVAGIVFAGFGDQEIFPALRSYRVRGVLAGHLQRMKDKSTTVGPGRSAGGVIPFAQGDVARTFLEGIDPNFRRVIQHAFLELTSELPDHIIDGLDELTDEEKAALKSKLSHLGTDLARQFIEYMREYRKSRHAEPILETISVLPKDELAQAARSLVQLTSFKRRVAVDQSETVKDPIDVVLISKGDGLIWIDRKHYFDPALNHHFFENYFDHEGPPSFKSEGDENE